MTQEQKDLLIKDLCGRLPYGVKVEYNGEKYKISNVSICNETVTIYGERGYPMEVEIKKVKPYLFPLSSMTEEQYDQLYIDSRVKNDSVDILDALANDMDAIEYLLKNNFDIHGLIPIGLANDATGLNIY